ncbi:MAG: helix-turn-helix domain-containing protein [Candidatus Dadabacteria bacterium]|nr:helix-turn-helix domain-containing protein [Candidatus Dadabacteria bacterium]
MTQDIDKLMTVEETAKELGVPQHKLYRWIQKGELIPLVFDGRKYFTQSIIRDSFAKKLKDARQIVKERRIGRKMK